MRAFSLIFSNVKELRQCFRLTQQSKTTTTWPQQPHSQISKQQSSPNNLLEQNIENENDKYKTCFN